MHIEALHLAKVIAGLPNNGTLEVWGQITFFCGGCSVHCRQLSRIPQLYLLDVSSTSSLTAKTKNVS